MPGNKPLYVVFEGGEGSGKSTQSRLLADRIGAVTTFEPGGTDTGQKLRQILLSPDTAEVDHTTELLLMAADRHQTMAEVVRPSLRQGRSVVSDRSFVSSLAYQGAGRDFSIDTVLDLNLKLGRVIMPDLLFIIQPPSQEELQKRMSIKGTLDKMESAGDEFHKKVAEAFGQMVHILAGDSRTQGIRTIEIGQEDASGLRTIETIHEDVFGSLVSFCEEERIVVPTPRQP